MQKASDYRETGMITTLGLDLAQSQQVCDKVVSEILGSNAILQVANVLFNSKDTDIIAIFCVVTLPFPTI